MQVGRTVSADLRTQDGISLQQAFTMPQ